ncbi:MAG: hypothetical protein AAF705_05825 [Bacteroidota bacterium]
MMKLVFKLTVLLLSVSLVNCTAEPNFGRREYTKTIKKEFDIASNGTTYLSNKYGEVDVKTWDTNRVKVSVNIVVNANSEETADEVFNRINVNFSNANDYVKVKTEIESKRSSWLSWGSNNNSSKSDYRINYEVYLPTTNNLDISHRYGDVYTAKMEGKVNFDLKYSNFKAEGVGDDSRITFAYGNGAILTAKDLSTSVSYGKLNINQSNDVSLESKYSQVWIEEGGDIRCETKYDTYRLGLINDFKNIGKYDNFTIERADNVTLESKYTALKSSQINQTVDLDMEYGSAQYNLAKGFTEVSMNGRYTDFKVNVDSGSNFKMDAVATYAGISYPESLEVTREISKSSSQEVKGYKGSQNANATIKATLNYGGLRVRVN